MSKVKGKDTAPELLVRRELWKRGFRYRIHDRSLPGTPDISNKGRKLAVFIDGCFWHACPLHFRYPKENALFWERKIRRNRERRNEVRAELRAMGFTVLEFFECEVRKSPEYVVNRIVAGFMGPKICDILSCTRSQEPLQ
jgi:DNA mismatch endonuclease (patch repair protein)